ncbi:hypothetical protein [Legionella gratiana]|nr:hypothetical protein [Legionella gratiana]
MKWIILLGTIILMTGCYCTNAVKYTPVYTPAITYTSTVAYKPVVTYQPVVRYRPTVTYRPVTVTSVITPVVQPGVFYSYPVESLCGYNCY